MTKKILFAGGLRAMQLRLADCLTGDHYQILHAPLGSDAVSMAISMAPDLIVLDLMAPEHKSVDIVRKIRTFNQDMQSVVDEKDIPIIVVHSPSVSEMSLKELRRLRVDAILRKPLERAAFRLTVDDVLSSSGNISVQTLKTILAVDPEPRVRMLYNSVLGDLKGYVVIGVEDAMHAFEQVEFQQLDLIITEQNLPDMSGLELLTALREIGNATPVLFVSSTTDEKVIAEAKTGGACEYVCKPFTIDNLRGTVRTVLSSKSPTPEPGESPSPPANSM